MLFLSGILLGLGLKTDSMDVDDKKSDPDVLSIPISGVANPSNGKDDSKIDTSIFRRLVFIHVFIYQYMNMHIDTCA
jgi:hypothetical protein